MYPRIAPVSQTGERPFWSVIVPAYKAQYLAHALKSVLAQDPGPAQMEILVIDDCSPQQLEPIVREVGRDRIRFYRNAANLGTYGNQNVGLNLCRGQWVHILNDDDWVLPGFYSTFQKSLESQPASVGAASCVFVNTDADGKPTFQSQPFRETPGLISNWIDTIGIMGVVHPICVVVRRSVHEHLGGFYPKLKYTADWEFYKRAAIYYQWWHEPALMACYREHAAACTAEAVQSGEQIREIGLTIDMTDPLLPIQIRQRVTAEAREANAIYAIKRADLAFRSGHLNAAMNLLKAGLQLSTVPSVTDHLVELLRQPYTHALRQLLPSFIQMINFKP